MKKFLIIIAMALLTACGAARYASQRTVNDMDEISYVLANYYPQLYEYYMEGVLNVRSIKEVVTPDGEPAYNVKYAFCRYHYPNFNERMDALHEYYPEVYEMYLNGVVEISSFYKYVDKETGQIRHHVSFRRVYDFYYNTAPYFGGTRLIYRPRPFPPLRDRYRPEPPRPRPEPRPEPRPGDRPGDRPGVGPGGQPGGQPGARPNNPPRQQPNTRPSNPPRTNPGGGNPGGGRPSNPTRSGGNPGGGARSGGRGR